MFYVGNENSYESDINTALYMLVGSWCSEWQISSVTRDTKIPFSIIYYKDEGEKSSA